MSGRARSPTGRRCGRRVVGALGVGAPARRASRQRWRPGHRFDVWKTESSTPRRRLGRARASSGCAQAGLVYEQDGATWFRSTDFGDDKDRVIYRTNGAPTYFAADIGYVMEKFSRGFDELIYIWGETTTARSPACATPPRRMGFDREAVQMLLYRVGPLRARGQAVSM